jgi:glycopeptide antibiotics resistance protein
MESWTGARMMVVDVAQAMRRPRLVAALGSLVLGGLAAAVLVRALVSHTTLGQTIEGYARSVGDSWDAFVSSPLAVLAAATLVLAVGLALTRPSRSPAHKVARSGLWAVFVAYAAFLVALTLFPLDFQGLTTRRFFLRNLVPFNGILDWFRAVGGGVDVSVAVKDILGNLIVFVPLGVLGPLLWPRLWDWRAMAVTGAVVSLCLELTQGIVDSGDPSFDDAMLNTLGTLAGFALMRVGRRLLGWISAPEHDLDDRDPLLPRPAA